VSYNFSLYHRFSLDSPFEKTKNFTERNLGSFSSRLTHLNFTQPFVAISGPIPPRMRQIPPLRPIQPEVNLTYDGKYFCVQFSFPRCQFSNMFVLSFPDSPLSFPLRYLTPRPYTPVAVHGQGYNQLPHPSNPHGK
jgi:hypothetical protein